MSVALVLAASLAFADPPPRKPGPEPKPRYIVGGVLVGIGGLLRVAGLSTAFSRDFDPDDSDGTWGTGIGGATAIAGAATLAHASYGLGWRRAIAGKTPRLRPALGWVLFGIGSAAVVTSRLVPRVCFENPCVIATGEATTWAGFTLAGVGLNLATFALGHRRGTYWSVSPSVSRRFGGLTVSARF